MNYSHQMKLEQVRNTFRTIYPRPQFEIFISKENISINLSWYLWKRKLTGTNQKRHITNRK
jgi:hypothetical protein